MPPPDLQALLQRYHQGSCTPAETRAVEAWYAAQPEGPPPNLSGPAREALRQALWQRLRPAPRGRWGAAPWQWLAAAAALAGLGVGGRWLLAPTVALRPAPVSVVAQGPARPWQVRRNATAQAQAVWLPDGSRATLQPTSQLRYRPGFAGGQRSVYLSGEAFFQVTHDAAHPFRVYTADVETRVLGTSFTVRAYPAQAETVVQVRTGRVRVCPLPRPGAGAAPAPGPLVLRPNQQVVYSPQRQQLHRELVAQPAQLAPLPFAFDNRPVAEVLEALQSAYGVDIRYSAAAVAGCTVNLNLRSQSSLFTKLDVLCQATGATYRQQDAQITFLSAGCE